MNNQTKPTRQLVLLAIIWLIWSCEAPKEDIHYPDVSAVEVTVEIERLEEKFFNLRSTEEQKQFLQEYPDLAEGYFRINNYPDTATLLNFFNDFISLSYNDTLLNDCQVAFADMSVYEQELSQAFRYIKFYYPDWEPPKVYSMVSGFGNFGWGGDTVIGEGFIVLGLDYWAGNALKYRPPEVPNYILRRYQPEFMVPSTIKLLSTLFNKYNGEDKTLLADMLFYGKSLHFCNAVMPNSPDSLIIGYSGQNLADVHYNLPKIWGHFVEQNLFYETLGTKKDRYVGERPATIEISTDCPGRIGRWLGWEIVDQYAKKHQMLLPAIMENTNAQQIFQQSGYKPNVQ